MTTEAQDYYLVFCINAVFFCINGMSEVKTKGLDRLPNTHSQLRLAAVAREAVCPAAAPLLATLAKHNPRGTEFGYFTKSVTFGAEKAWGLLSVFAMG